MNINTWKNAERNCFGQEDIRKKQKLQKFQSKILPRDQIWLKAQICLVRNLVGEQPSPNPAHMKKCQCIKSGTLEFLCLNFIHGGCIFYISCVTETKKVAKNVQQSTHKFLAICAKRRNFEFSANFFRKYPEICLKNVR